MFPMIGRVEEWRAAKLFLMKLKLYIHAPTYKLIMIEVPSAALLAPILAKEVDFSVSEQMT